MTTMTLSPATAQLALVKADADNKIALMKRDMLALKEANGTKDQALARLSASMQVQTSAGRVAMGVSTVLTAGSAWAGGAMDGYLTAKNSEKIGPVKFTSVAGFGAALTGVAVNDVLVGEFFSSIGRGLVAGPLYQAGYTMGQNKANAAPAAPAPAPAAPPAKR